MKTKSLAILSSAFEMKRLLKQKSSRMMLHFSISDCIVDLRCVSAVHDFVVRVLMECSYGLIFFSLSVFIYSMPGYTCSIRERMLYSSCKSPLLEIVETQLWMQIIRKVSTLGILVFPPSPCSLLNIQL